MRFEQESFNSGSEVFREEFNSLLSEVESAISDSEYQVKHTFQKGREKELIFDPIGTNRALREKFSEHGWATEVNLDSPGYDKGKDIDIAKNGVAGEIQFGNFAYLDADCNRLRRLYDGRLELEGGGGIQAGVIIVVKQEMPTSQSVSHFQQATQRAAPTALVNRFTCPECGAEVDTGIPSLIFGIEAPRLGDEVVFNTYESQRSRTLVSHERISFKEKYYQ